MVRQRFPQCRPTQSRPEFRVEPFYRSPVVDARLHPTTQTIDGTESLLGQRFKDEIDTLFVHFRVRDVDIACMTNVRDVPAWVQMAWLGRTQSTNRQWQLAVLRVLPPDA